MRISLRKPGMMPRVIDGHESAAGEMTAFQRSAVLLYIQAKSLPITHSPDCEATLPRLFPMC